MPKKKFSESDEKAFQDWYKGISGELGLNPNPDHPKHFYDYRGYWDSLRRGKIGAPAYQPEHRQIRFPDEFKLKGHPEPAHQYWDHPIDRRLHEED